MRLPIFWDKRALAVGSAGGLVFSNLLAWSYYQPVWNVLLRDWGRRWAFDFLLVWGVLGCLVTPAVVSALARDRPFAWGLLPLTVFWAFLNIEQWYELGSASVFRTLPETVVIAAVCLFVSSGPVAFVRMILDKRRQEAEENAHWEQRRAARRPPEETWPPPPSETNK